MSMLHKCGRRWQKLPEAARWALFLPCLLLSWAAFNLLFHFLALGMEPLGWPGAEIRRIVLSGIGAGASAAAFFPLLFFLAPRAQIAIGWCFYSIFMLINVFVVLRAALMVLPGIAPEWATWESKDWHELAQAIGWLLAGTYSFRYSIRQQKSHTPLHSTSSLRHGAQRNM